MDETLLASLREMQPELAAIRQDIHAHPEIGMEEERTSALVAAKLREYGLQVEEGIGKYGVVATLKGRLPGQRAIGLRADMDALLINEATGLPYASRHQGKMHACGHDGHTTMLLGAAKYLARHPDFGGTVHFIFQPAEEGRGGAVAMLEDGLFDRFPVDAVYGLHNDPGLPLGTFSTRVGPALAASDRWFVTFRGTGGHGGAAPHLSTDVTVVQAQFIMALQTIVSRNVAAVDAAVISVGAVAGGSFGSVNVMPSEIRIGGTSRSYVPAVRDLMEKRLAELAHSVAASFGCTAEPEYLRGTTALVNHAEQTGIALAAAGALVGNGRVDPNAPQTTGGEDFAHMLEARPGAFMFMGQGAGGATSEGLHTPTYNFNDDAIPFGAGYWVSLVRQEMGAAA
ncbi:M20 aminoacylase family protein [Roseomonas marmotae]|uniref:Amidohydrolase n=1 Tax=Roseomonas marmotae TaxID=2768161 RepID=A0ABS3KAB1_9PROT|nr:M20 aminoacylase family protein [Roseomonas marmotae]MBO1074382.1 amidohydrolase [Roseomonas marmotae]QTI78125.1 amidohydrolase [Roseomonas marmotae]